MLINGRAIVPEKIIIVEDIKSLLSVSRNYSVDYCSMDINREADILAKRACL